MTRAVDKQGNKSVNALILIVMQCCEGRKQGSADSIMDMWTALERMVRKGFSTEVTFGQRPREKRVSMQREIQGRAFWAKEARGKQREGQDCRAGRKARRSLGPGVRGRREAGNWPGPEVPCREKSGIGALLSEQWGSTEEFKQKGTLTRFTFLEKHSASVSASN